MSSLGSVSATLFTIAEAIDRLEELLPREEPEPEDAGCCATIGDAHEHGRELGWWSAMTAVHDAFDATP